MLYVSPMKKKPGFAMGANSLSCALAKEVSPGLGLNIREKTSGAVIGGFSSLGIRLNLLLI